MRIPGKGLSPMNGKRKRCRDDDDEPRKQALTDEGVKERRAELVLRQMSCESRSHCARFPYWQVCTWQEKLIIATETEIKPTGLIDKRWPDLRSRHAAYAEDKLLEQVTRDMSGKLDMDGGQENAGGSPQPVEPSWKLDERTVEEKRRDAIEAERGRELGQVPATGFTWYEVERKVFLLLMHGGFTPSAASSVGPPHSMSSPLGQACEAEVEAEEAAQRGTWLTAVKLLSDCKEEGRKTLRLRTMLRSRSPLHNPYRFLLTLLTPLESRLNQAALDILRYWTSQAEAMTLKNLNAVAGVEKAALDRREASQRLREARGAREPLSTPPGGFTGGFPGARRGDGGWFAAFAEEDV